MTGTHSPSGENLGQVGQLSTMLACIALNLALGTVVSTLKLPVYLDAVGTILATLMLGWRAGAVVGVASFLAGGVLTNPVLPWFSGTQIAIALYTSFAARRGMLRGWLRTVLSGVGLGVVAGIVSAPVIVGLFGGITGSGPSLVVAYLLATGRGLLKSVVLSGIASEPLDKTLQLVLAIWIARTFPTRLKQRYGSRLSSLDPLEK